MSPSPAGAWSPALVVFDLAGTLVDCGSRAPVEAFQATLSTSGVTASEDEVRQFMGMAKRDHLEALLALSNLRRSFTAHEGREPGSDDLDRLYEAFTPLQIEAVRRRAALVPDARESLDHLRRTGVRIAVTSGYPRIIGEELLDAARPRGLDPDISLFTDEVPNGRPAPDLVHRVMQTEDLTDPARVVTIGDTPADVRTGRAAGTWTLGLTLTGNTAALDAETLESMDPAARRTLHDSLAPSLLEAGAHLVLPTLADLGRAFTVIGKAIEGGASPELPSLEQDA